MTSDDGRRWRALRAWYDDFPPDDQERLLGYLEHLMTLAQGKHGHSLLYIRAE